MHNSRNLWDSRTQRVTSKPLRPAGFGAALALAALGSASASTSTGSFPVTLTIQGVCSLQTASTLAFGAQTAIASNLDSTSSIAVLCTNATPYTVGLSAGSGSGATVATRILTNGAATLPYSIYQDAAHSQVWGFTTGVDTQSGTGTGSNQTFTAYGRVPPASNLTAGAYTDTVSVTVTY
jgi:spore coat protein U-like protein